MDCYLCNSEPDINVPLLQCKHYCCPKCYCDSKNNNKNNCLLCNKLLRRGKKKNIGIL